MDPNDSSGILRFRSPAGTDVAVKEADNLLDLCE